MNARSGLSSQPGSGLMNRTVPSRPVKQPDWRGQRAICSKMSSSESMARVAVAAWFAAPLLAAPLFAALLFAALWWT